MIDLHDIEVDQHTGKATDFWDCNRFKMRPYLCLYFHEPD